jgi:hypothetical protein
VPNNTQCSAQSDAKFTAARPWLQFAVDCAHQSQSPGDARPASTHRYVASTRVLVHAVLETHLVPRDMEICILFSRTLLDGFQKAACSAPQAPALRVYRTAAIIKWAFVRSFALTTVRKPRHRTLDSRTARLSRNVNSRLEHATHCNLQALIYFMLERNAIWSLRHAGTLLETAKRCNFLRRAQAAALMITMASPQGCEISDRDINAPVCPHMIRLAVAGFAPMLAPKATQAACRCKQISLLISGNLAVTSGHVRFRC